jgi:hypothetical protein
MITGLGFIWGFRGFPKELKHVLKQLKQEVFF